MNLKEIRIIGFKSFADKTSIKFEDGVTCIVGPNGCGKSNVADAVRWVLGEQSAKTLRGANMQDVIFNGTETRRQLSYCEITLVFDNSKHIFNLDYDEVAITRRLYRSGKSEYQINMQDCRLRDIIAHLHDAGMAKEGYSIIGQGRVEQIMNSKPYDRRSVFEEATGVFQFREKRRDIEGKIAASKDDLAVFAQRMDETERQLRPLEKQAEVEKKYREYSAQLRYEEINSYLVHFDSFSTETEKYDRQIADTDLKLGEVERRLAALDEEERTGREAALAADDLLRELNEKLRLFEVGMERKTGEAKVIDERIQAYRRQLSQATDDVEYSIRRTREIDALVTESEKKQKSGEKHAAEILHDLQSLRTKLGEAEARVQAFERLTDEKRAGELKSVENLADVRANAGSLSAQRDAASERLQEVRRAIEKAQERKTEFSRQLADCVGKRAVSEKFLDDCPARETELKATIEDLTRSIKKIGEEIAECNSTIANLTNNLEMYRNLKNRFEGYRDSVRRLQLVAKENPEIGKRIQGAIADIVSTEKKYEVAIETAFGAAMQNLVTETSDDARYLIEYLKKTGGGIVTFLPVNGMRPHTNSREIILALREKGACGLAEELVKYDARFDNVVRNLIGNTLVCDTIASANEISKKYPRAFKLVTLDGDIISQSGAMTGGSRKKESGNLLAGERRIKECEEGIARKKAAAEKLEGALASCEEELAEAEQAYETFRIDVQKEMANYAALAQQNEALNGLVADAEKDETEYAGLLEQLTRRIDDLESEVTSTAESEELLQKIRRDAAAEADAQQEEAARLRAERDALSTKIHDLEVEAATLTSACEAERDSSARMKEEKERLLAKVEETRKGIVETQSRIEQLKLQEERVVLTAEERQTVSILRERLAETETKKSEQAEKQAKLAEEKRTLIARQMTLTEAKHSFELDISRIQANLENLKQRITEAYGLDHEGALALRDEGYDVSQAATRISTIKRNITQLGPSINHSAVEDYEELLQRYSEMQTKRQDLEKGIDDLTTALTQLKNEMETQFNEGFNAINENFKHIFKELFGGGKAEMKLDFENCEDPLDAGVEIVACPPGKKLGSISLLSGGERAFTAIAILFAILKNRPMPFCILDEIEAALDEANVDRFARYLKKFSADTQFIVITHRKPTMNQADTLFGVTMEEKGVSKIVSVKLSEVESRLGGDTVM